MESSGDWPLDDGEPLKYNLVDQRNDFERRRKYYSHPKESRNRPVPQPQSKTPIPSSLRNEIPHNYSHFQPRSESLKNPEPHEFSSPHFSLPQLYKEGAINHENMYHRHSPNRDDLKAKEFLFADKVFLASLNDPDSIDLWTQNKARPHVEPLDTARGFDLKHAALARPPAYNFPK